MNYDEIFRLIGLIGFFIVLPLYMLHGYSLAKFDDFSNKKS